MSQIIGLPVKEASTGRRIGRITDLAANMKELYPKVGSLIVKKNGGGLMSVPLRNVKKLEEEKYVEVELPSEGLPPGVTLAENEILLKETFWDKQIVDISGSKVVRVNDLHLLRETPSLWVVHVDVGIKGLVRRLGWSGWLEPMIVWIFSEELREKLISWKYVQPINADKGGSQLSLKGPKTKLTELHPADLADILTDLGVDERVSILKTLDTVTSANTLKELPIKIRVQTALLIDQERLSKIMTDMPVDEAVDLIAHFPKKKANATLVLMTKEKAKQIKTLLEMKGTIAGSIMNVEYIAVKHTLTAGQVLEKIKTESKGKETIYYIYVLDDADALAGAVTLRQLLTAPPEKLISEVMRKRVARVRVDTDIRDVAQVFYKYDFTVVPVVDKHNKMQGIVTIKDALESVFPEIKEELER